MSRLIMRDKERSLIIPGLFLVFFLLRLYRLGFHDLWYDEVITTHLVLNPWHIWNPPLYYILLHFWIKVFGASEAALRFPSLIFSFASLIILFRLGARLFNKKAGLWASVIMGLSPFQLWYAQEARNYSLALLLGLLSTYLLVIALDKKKVGYWIGFALVSIAGVYSNYFLIFLTVSQGLYLLLFRGQFQCKLKHVIIFLSIGLGFLPYIRRFSDKFFTVWSGFWINAPTLRSLSITIENFILGYNSHFWAYLAADIIAIVLLAGACAGLREKALRPRISLCLAILLGPILLSFLFSRLLFPIYLDRALIIASPGLYLLLGLGIAALPKKKVAALLAASLCALLIYAGYAYYHDWMPLPYPHHAGTYIKKPVKPITAFIEDAFDDQDLLVLSNYSLWYSLEYYFQRNIPIHSIFAQGGTDSDWRRPLKETDIFIPLERIDRRPFRRLWLVANNWERDGKLGEVSKKITAYLDTKFRLALTKELEGSWIFVYEH